MKKENLRLGETVVISSGRCNHKGKVGRVVGIIKDHHAPRQRVYVRFPDKVEPEVYSAQSLSRYMNN